jgi:hypothetical protein
MLQLLTMAVHIQLHARDAEPLSPPMAQKADEDFVQRGTCSREHEKMVHLFRLKPGCALSSYAVSPLYLPRKVHTLVPCMTVCSCGCMGSKICVKIPMER